VRNHSEAWKNKNIYLWVTKESEEVLVEDRVPSPCWVKEGCVEVSVGEEHGNSSGENREG